jgi:hypothetical protein
MLNVDLFGGLVKVGKIKPFQKQGTSFQSKCWKLALFCFNLKAEPA